LRKKYLLPLTKESCDLLISGGFVITVSDREESFFGDVAITGNSIVAVGQKLDFVASKTIDASGCAVMPGFVNAHMHETLDRGVFEDLPFTVWLNEFALPKDTAYTPEHIRAAALLNQTEMIANGTTTFIDIFRHPNEAAAVAERSGLRAIFSPQLIDDPLGPGESLNTTLGFMERWNGRVPDRIHTWFGPHAMYSCSAETLREIRVHADRMGLGIHIHLAETPFEVEWVAQQSNGKTPTEYLDELIGLGSDVLAAHCIELTNADMDRLAATGVGVAHCPTSNAKLGNGVARVVEMQKRGVRVGLGTDSNMTNNNLDMIEEMRMASLVQKQLLRDPTVLSSFETLRLATRGSAEALGMGDIIGSLEPGKRADIAIVDLCEPHMRPIVSHGRTNIVEQVVWSGSGSDVRDTIVDGKVLMRNRVIQTLDTTDLIEVADIQLLDLLTRAGVLEKRFAR
jgi:5-methylthioadenosine/S-adenosylhomocysteine deaminase